MIVQAEKNRCLPELFVTVTKSFFSIIVIFLLLTSGHARAAAEDGTAAEYAVKAAYIYNILRFVSWDESSQLAQTDSLNICLFKKNPFGQYLEPINKKSIGKKPITLKTINDISKSALCHLIFIENNKDFEQLIAKQGFMHSDSILLGNGIEFIEQGGLFSFYIEDNKVRLSANMKAIADSELNISSLLIEVCQLHGETR